MPSMTSTFPALDLMRTSVPGGEGGGGGGFDMNPFLAELLKRAFTKQVTAGQQLNAVTGNAPSFGQAAPRKLRHEEHAFNTVPKKLVHGSGIIPGEQFDTMRMTAAQRQAFLPQNSSFVAGGASTSAEDDSPVEMDPASGLLKVTPKKKA